MAFELRLLSLCPRIRKRGGQLVAATAWSLRLLALGLFWREVVADPKHETVSVRRHFLWFFRRGRRIPFRSVGAVTYGYHDESPFASWSWTHDSVDLFSVGLRLQSGRDVHLFHFFGDGTFTNDSPLPDWFYWEEYATDLSGTQERESRAFVDVLAAMIGVPVEPARR
jgi:hypothetical protein